MSCYEKAKEIKNNLIKDGLIEEEVVIVNFSGGKDSTAMLLRMIELGEKIDYIIFADTNFEFPLLYEYINKISTLIGRKIEIVKPSSSFDSWRFGTLTKGKNKGDIRGFPQVLTPCYWMRESKVNAIENFGKKFKNKVNCLGIAFDETERVQKDKSLRYPLIEWGWTEEKCLDYLQEKGLINDLYKHFSRIGCWMCPKQSSYSRYMLWKHYPKLWGLFKIMESENLKDTNRTIWLKHSSHYEFQYKSGHIPKDNGKICFECKGVRKSFTKQTELNKEW